MKKRPPAAEHPWYHEGLQFECIACGRCCTGAPGYVWVGPEEIKTLAALVRLSIEQFEERFVRRVGRRKSLIELHNGDCVFFDNELRRCQVYADRPFQCRTWPFWESNVRTPKAWGETCHACPGCGQGPVHAVEEIEAQVRTIRI